jgi:hypothetical protein
MMCFVRDFRQLAAFNSPATPPDGEKLSHQGLVGTAALPVGLLIGKKDGNS